MKTNKQILKRTFSQVFINKMKNRILTSFHKYGDLTVTKQDATQHRDELKNAEYRLSLYKKTGNTEYLVDAANFLMFEFMEMHGNFLPTDNDKNSFIVGDIK